MAVQFSTGYLQYADNPAFDFTTDLTISAWALADTFPAGAAGEIIRKDGNYIVRWWNSGGNGIDLLWWDNTNIRRMRATPPSTGAWHHYLVQVSANDAYKIFIDNVDSGGAITNLATTGRVLTNDLQIGGNASAENWDGRIAEVGMWNVVLDAGERAALLKRYSPEMIRPAALKFYSKVLRAYNDRRTGLVGSVNGTLSVVEHPPMIYPRRRFLSAAATSPPPPPGTFPGARLNFSYNPSIHPF